MKAIEQIIEENGGEGKALFSGTLEEYEAERRLRSNLNRAHGAAESLDELERIYKTGNPQDTLVDFLTNLMHYAEYASVDLKQALRTAEMHFEAETGGGVD